MIEKEAYLHINDYSFFTKFISPTQNILPQATLVFLHEGLGSIAHWKDFPQQLCKATGYGGFLYDRSGYGKSDLLTNPRPLDYLEREALNILPAILEQNRISNPILIGHSDGGTIALLFAAKFPEMVRGVITEAAHVFVEEITLQGIKDSLKAFSEDKELKAKLVKYQGKHAYQIISDWKNIWLSSEFRDWNIEKNLSNITCPVFVMQGENDDYGSPAQVDAIANQVSGFSQKLIISDCGHRPHHQAREIVLQEMTQFIKRIINEKGEVV
jgi:pimeloyl-ACP methyl ester carboxylesterase